MRTMKKMTLKVQEGRTTDKSQECATTKKSQDWISITRARGAKSESGITGAADKENEMEIIN